MATGGLQERKRAYGRRTAAPYGGVAKLRAAPEAELLDRGPSAAPPRWIRPLADYARHEAKEFYIARFG
jgi:hypothetical protein